MDLKQVLAQLERINRMVDQGCPKIEVLRALDALQLDIEIHFRRMGVQLVTC